MKISHNLHFLTGMELAVGLQHCQSIDDLIHEPFQLRRCQATTPQPHAFISFKREKQVRYRLGLDELATFLKPELPMFLFLSLLPPLHLSKSSNDSLLLLPTTKEYCLSTSSAQHNWLTTA